MVNLRKNNKGQAATEVAIMGSLIILAFSYLISLAARINVQQLQIQESFKVAKKEAFNQNVERTGGNFKYTRLPNITNPYEPGELVIVSGGGKVLWSNGAQEEPNYIDVTSPDTYAEAGSYKVVFTRTENPGSYPETHRKVYFPSAPSLNRAGENQP